MLTQKNDAITYFDGVQLRPPSRWTNNGAKMIYEAGVSQYKRQDFSAAGTIRFALTPAPGMSPYGAPPDQALATALGYAKKLRAEAQRIENVAEMHGGEAFVTRAIVVRSPKIGTDAQDLIVSLMKRRDVTHILIGDKTFTRGKNGIVSDKDGRTHSADPRNTSFYDDDIPM